MLAQFVVTECIWGWVRKSTKQILLLQNFSNTFPLLLCMATNLVKAIVTFLDEYKSTKQLDG